MKNMKDYLLFYFLLGIGFFSFNSFGESNKIIFATDPWPPYIYPEKNEWKGFMVPIIKEIVSEIPNAEILFEELPWKRVLVGLRQGKVDMTGPLLFGKERAEYLNFTVSSHSDPISVWTKLGKDNLPIIKYKDEKELSKYTLALQFKHKYTPKVDLMVKRKELEPYFVNTNLQKIKMLKVGRVDGFIKARLPGLSVYNKHKKKFPIDNLVIVTPPLRVNNYHFAISKKSKFSKYLKKINQKITYLKDSGAFEKAISNYQKLVFKKK